MKPPRAHHGYTRHRYPHEQDLVGYRYWDSDARPRSTTAKAALGTISAALNNIGDLWDEFGQYTSGGRWSGMPPGDAR